ncbi:MAG: LacI family DNA-binding transcriptional regulator [Candidatus Gygaella obscura]|nr:LacI family DNA-binding transcriptional regulator [Candidatus Gygaella obscura]
MVYIPKKVSIEDVARLAGVSEATVSRVINKLGTVKKINRIKVEDVIKRLKFVPNVSAQRLAKGVSNSIALVIPHYEGIFFSFFAIEILRGVGIACEQLKMDLLLHIAKGEDSFNLKGLGGVIFADILNNRKQLEKAVAEDVNCVVINNLVEDLKVSSIYIDNKKGAQLAVEYLIGLGHKEIAVVTGDLMTQAAAERLEGYKDALGKKKIPIRDDFIIKGDYSRRCARDAAEKLLSLDKRPTAIFACSDDMALEVMQVVMEHNLKVPKDVSIIGFDDNPQCLYAPIALTTVRQPLLEMSKRAVLLLKDLISSKKQETSKELLSTQLVIRDSCQAV